MDETIEGLSKAVARQQSVKLFTETVDNIEGLQTLEQQLQLELLFSDC